MNGWKRFRTARAWVPAALVAVAMMIPFPAVAEVEHYEIDKEHTSITFKIRHFFSKVPGRFDEFSGEISLDRQDWSKSTVNVTIQTASINTNEAARDKHLRIDDFFAAEKHPRITFRSTSIKPVGDKKLAITGDLTIRGITKQVTLDAEVLGFWEYYNRERAGFQAKTTINRYDYKVSWNDTVEGLGVLGEEVEIEINLEAKKKPQEQAG